MRYEAMINRPLINRGQALTICYLSPPDFFLWGYLKDRVYQE